MKSMPKSIWLEVNSKYTVCTPHIYIHTDIIRLRGRHWWCHPQLKAWKKDLISSLSPWVTFSMAATNSSLVTYLIEYDLKICDKSKESDMPMCNVVANNHIAQFQIFKNIGWRPLTGLTHSSNSNHQVRHDLSKLKSCFFIYTDLSTLFRMFSLTPPLTGANSSDTFSIVSTQTRLSPLRFCSWVPK